MKIIHSSAEFRYRVRTLRYEDDFWDLDIRPDTDIGIFFPPRLEEMIHYCMENPHLNLHVVSFVSGPYMIRNAPHPRASFYYLAEGEKDPDIFYVEKKTFEDYLEDIVDEFDVEENLPTFEQFKKRFYSRC